MHVSSIPLFILEDFSMAGHVTSFFWDQKTSIETVDGGRKYAIT